ncbi:uncharacterized protein LOC107398764 isoform X1 [Tribolium castaneum]|nr:PREDICTED: odorant receptor 22c-like isoform X1 [Tribolium castaneum]|eukprot:XP_015839537.1 PREDICTED: odorant receptor 22c-like isoform X1 [Tribolium castaneum]
MIADLPKDIITDSLKMLRLGRHHPTGSIWWTIFFIPVNTFFCSLLIILSIVGIVRYHEDDVFLAVDCLGTCTLMLHAISKQIFLHAQKNAINVLLKMKSQFWNLDDFDGEISKECEMILTSGKIAVRIYFSFTCAAATFYFLQPFTAHHLPSDCYVPEGWFPFLAISYMYLIPTLVPSVVGLDALFWALGLSLAVQFKLLAQKFKLLGTCHENETAILWNQLKELINYHRFLIDFCKKLNKLFSFIFFVQSFITITSASVAVFIVMQPGNLSTRVKCLLTFVSYILEMAFYCLPAEMSVNAAIDVADSVYNSKWFRIKSTEFKKCLILIIGRAQIPFTFSGFGLIHINIRMFQLVCKTTFTFYTYLNTVQNRQ